MTPFHRDADVSGIVLRQPVSEMDPGRRCALPRREGAARYALVRTGALRLGMKNPVGEEGPGAEERRAVATVVIGGQSLALLLTLLVTPVVQSGPASHPARWPRRRIRKSVLRRRQAT